MKIHYFQRYHGPENVATANTMLLLSRLYHYSPDKFFNVFKSEFFKDAFEPEIVFELQTKTEKSIPDAAITQSGFKIVVETKPKAKKFNNAQLMEHVKGLANSVENEKILLTLAPQLMEKNQKESFEKELETFNADGIHISHVNITFEGIAKAVQDVIDGNRDYEMQEILDDFLEYLDYAGLITNSSRLMRVQLAGTTIESNMKYNVYYMDAHRGFTAQDYLGLYADKTVKAIGKICARITAVKNAKNGEIEYKAEVGELTDERKEIIKQAIEDAKGYKYDLERWEHRYFFVEKFYETNFIKVSNGGLMGTKIFNLLDIINEGRSDKIQTLPDTQEIGKLLNGKEWK